MRWETGSSQCLILVRKIALAEALTISLNVRILKKCFVRILALSARKSRNAAKVEPFGIDSVQFVDKREFDSHLPFSRRGWRRVGADISRMISVSVPIGLFTTLTTAAPPFPSLSLSLSTPTIGEINDTLSEIRTESWLKNVELVNENAIYRETSGGDERRINRLAHFRSYDY